MESGWRGPALGMAFWEHGSGGIFGADGAVQNFQASFGKVPDTQLDIGIIGPARGIVACTLRVQARIPGIRRSRSERTTFPLTPALAQGRGGVWHLRQIEST